MESNVTEIVDKSLKLLDREEQRARTNVRDFYIEHFRKNSSFARSLKMYDLDYIHKIEFKPSLHYDDNALAVICRKMLGLSRSALNLMDKAITELEKNKELKLKKGLQPIKEEYIKYKNKHAELNNCVIDFLELKQKAAYVPSYIHSEQLSLLRRTLWDGQMDLSSIYLNVFEGTSVLTGISKKAPEEELEKEIV